MHRAFLRVMVYVFPLLIWLGICALAATELGSYARSWNLIHWFLDKVQPGFYYPDPQIVSMYQLTQVTRRLAHIGLYGVLTLLLVRVFQRGNSRLRARSMLGASLIATVFMGIESYIRLKQSEGLRHVRPEQFFLNGIGVGAALVLVVLYFGLKALERWLLSTPHPPPGGGD